MVAVARVILGAVASGAVETVADADADPALPVAEGAAEGAGEGVVEGAEDADGEGVPALGELTALGLRAACGVGWLLVQAASETAQQLRSPKLSTLVRPTTASR